MVARLNTELNAVLRDKDVWQKLVRAGVTNDGGTPQQLAAFVRHSGRISGETVPKW